MTTRADAQKWFLQWSTATYGFSGTDGRPWGDDTFMAKRQAASKDPWDEGCTVTPLIGGYETLCMIADTLEQAITVAGGLTGDKGHVYITDWRLNPLRDMSRANLWKAGKWNDTQDAAKDQTAIGLILKLMQAGVKVRVLVWLPVTTMRAKGMAPHIDEHFWLAEMVAKEAERIGSPSRGIVGLDSRVADPLTATHHQKMCVIRVGTLNVAFVGGVDWAFTRRDAPADPTATGPGVYQYDETKISDLTWPAPQFLAGDWQSGNGIPVPFELANKAHRWPDQTTPAVTYDAAKDPSRPGQSPTDLPQNVYGTTQQVWHDQHFRLTGPIVRTVEEQFVERWMDAGDTHELGPYGSSHWFGDQVIFSQKEQAYDGNGIVALDGPADADPTGSSYVQMWRTIPLRKHRKTGRLSQGEFTIMAGIANATSKAEQLIWLFDQYFFSEPLARQLNARLTASPNLHVIVVLPPFADDNPLHLIHLRKLALNDLVANRKTADRVYDRVAIYNTWNPTKHLGIYVHAKAKMFDDRLVAIGSGNLNRRSFTCDTELDCAVLDDAVLDLHQRRLWKCLFPSSAWPLSSPRTGNWGKTFFDSFVTAAAQSDAFLIKDPWDTETFTTQTRQVTHENAKGLQRTDTVTTITVTPPKVPTQPPTAREQSYRGDFRTTANAGTRLELVGQTDGEMPVIDMNALIEPSSLDLAVETTTSGKSGDPGPAGRLDEIVYLIEGVAGSKNTFPHRKR